MGYVFIEGEQFLSIIKKIVTEADRYPFASFLTILLANLVGLLAFFMRLLAKIN